MLRLGEQSPPPLWEGRGQDKLCLQGHSAAAAEPCAGRRGNQWATAHQFEGRANSSDIFPASSGRGYLSLNMDLALRCYSLFRMLFLYRMFPVTGSYSCYSQVLILEGGKKGKKPRWQRWRAGAELHGQSQPFPVQTAFFLRLIPEARYGPGWAILGVQCGSLPLGHQRSNLSSAKGCGSAEKPVCLPRAWWQTERCRNRANPLAWGQELPHQPLKRDLTAAMAADRGAVVIPQSSANMFRYRPNTYSL